MTSAAERPREVWGLLGGMGPLASAEFLATIYERSTPETEQELPTVLLLSDPAIPDRTEALLEGRESDLVRETGRRVRILLDGGVTRLVFCCVTLHGIVPLLPPAVRGCLVSLVDLIFDAVEQNDGPHLMLCSAGTRQTRLFQNHERWSRVGSRIRFLNDDDQQQLHSWIYQIKRNMSSGEHSAFINKLASLYDVDSCIAGCTEMHIVAKHDSKQAGGNAVRWIDPLSVLASRIAGRDSN